MLHKASTLFLELEEVCLLTFVHVRAVRQAWDFVSRSTAPHRDRPQQAAESPDADDSPIARWAYRSGSAGEGRMAPRAISPFEKSPPQGIDGLQPFGGGEDGETRQRSPGHSHRNMNGTKPSPSFSDFSDLRDLGTTSPRASRNKASEREHVDSGALTARDLDNNHSHTSRGTHTQKAHESDQASIKATKASRLRQAKNAEKLESTGRGWRDMKNDPKLRQLAEQIAQELHRSKRVAGDHKKAAFR
jgi:hypothetical protein